MSPQIFNYQVVLVPETEGFSVVMPAIPEICTQGNTADEALKNAEEAIECYLESCAERGEEPEQDSTETYQLRRLFVTAPAQ